MNTKIIHRSRIMQLYFYTIITANIHQNFELPRKFIEINYREKLPRKITEKKPPKIYIIKRIIQFQKISVPKLTTHSLSVPKSARRTCVCQCENVDYIYILSSSSVWNTTQRVGEKIKIVIPTQLQLGHAFSWKNILKIMPLNIALIE